jgi:hypothetical protein
MKRNLIYIQTESKRGKYQGEKRKRINIFFNIKKHKIDESVLGKRKRITYVSDTSKKPYVEDLYYFYWMLF